MSHQSQSSRLTRPMLRAVEASLDAALAGEGFNGGDFEGMKPQHFDAALSWAQDLQDPADDLACDDRWNAGVNYAIERLCEVFGVDPKSISWDAATETLDGDVMSVLCNVMVAAYGEEWSSKPGDTAKVRGALNNRFADEHARLVAAAPAMLEAAKLAMEGIEVLDHLISSIEKHGNYSVESTLGFLNQARCAKMRLTEAISSAQGEASTSPTSLHQ